MSIRKREWITRKGQRKMRWIVDYFSYDPAAKKRVRAIKTFDKERDAKNFAATTRVAIGKGLHVPESRSVTVQEAGEAWLKSCRTERLEETTVVQYEQHFNLRLVPEIGSVKLAHITVPGIRQLQERLREMGCSPQMVRGCTGDLGRIFAFAQERGLAAHNPVRELSGRRKGGANPAKRRRKLEVGTEIPKPEEIRAILGAATGRWKPLLMTAALTGLRASELRGLRWDDVDLTKCELQVRQRADRYNVIGALKSAAGRRTVPLTPGLAQALRIWKLECPKLKKDKDDPGRLVLVFPNGRGGVEELGNIRTRGLIPAVLAAGLTLPKLDKDGVPVRDEEGRPVLLPKYSGLHCFRHFFASWCINRRADGGLELPLKVAQERLGHASVTMTADTYGHLFPRGDDSAELAAAEKALLG